MQHQEMDIDEVNKVAENLKNSVAIVLLIGGEPFVRKDIALVGADRGIRTECRPMVWQQASN